GTTANGEDAGDFPPPADVLMLHASLVDDSAPDDVFQPIQSADIEGSEQRLWILGHQREPDLVTLGDNVVLEPGALCPLDPWETGPRGAWIVDSDDPASARFLALSPVQFEDVD